MASRKMTFTLPGELAAEFVRRVPPSHRSSYVASAIAAQLKTRQSALARSCQAANAAAGALDIEAEFDALADRADRVEEPW
jgi:hypothetical protein